LSANRLALDLGVPSGRITDVLNGRRSITADTAPLRLGRYFGNDPQFWLELQSQHDLAVVEAERGASNRPTQLEWSSRETPVMWRATRADLRPGGNAAP
jgi:addiction module HigA family antidote